MKASIVFSAAIAVLTSVVAAANPNYWIELDGASSGEIWPSANSTKANAPPANSADAIGFNFSASAPLGGSATTGAGAGKIEFVPMVIWKHPDAGSPKLLQAALTGEAIKSGTLNVQQPAGTDQTAITMKYTFQNAQIIEFSQHGHDTQVVEKIVLSFAKVTLSVTAGSSTTTTSSKVK